MRRSESITKLIPALIAARGEMKPALKTAENPHYKSRYVDLAGVEDACTEALHKHGLTILQTTETADRGVTLLTTLVHDSGEWIESEYPLVPVKADPQGLGSALTYGRRYQMMAVSGLAPEDDDGNAASGHSGTPARTNRNGRDRSPREERNGHAHANGHSQTERPAQPEPKHKPVLKTLDNLVDRFLSGWSRFAPPADEQENRSRQHRLAHAMVSAAIELDLIDEAKILKPAQAGKDPVRDPAKVWDCLKWLWRNHRDWLISESRGYLMQKKREATKAQPAKPLPKGKGEAYEDDLASDRLPATSRGRSHQHPSEADDEAF